MPTPPRHPSLHRDDAREYVPHKRVRRPFAVPHQVIVVLTLSLSPHHQRLSGVTRIEAGVARSDTGRLRLTYRLFGDLDEVAIAPAQAATRTDELWKHTCFEAFVAVVDGYYEYNLSPSGQWAAYRFDTYREGMREAAHPDPQIAWDGKGELTALIHLPPDATGSLGISAVIEATDGSRSYWALAHPPGAPDFHNAACFTAELPPAD